MNNTLETSVLLVGLGGIGSEIVDNVYGRMKREGRASKVEAVVLDTDVNSQKRLKNIAEDRKIQTSTNNVVKYVLENNPSTKEWFPSNPLIEKMQLVNGAGQIRSVSRLALYAAIKDEKLNVFDAVKLSLNKLGSNIEKNGLRVMIVSSLMGGTGSGIFLQIPLYIRDTFENAQNYDKLDIQGTFLLPDILTGSIMKDMTDNVYANAYAAMKELSAINTSINNPEDGINIDLEYKPNQIDKFKIRDISIKDNPYNYCYFYDKEDTKGRVLGTLEDYKRMIADNVYTQVSGPMSDKIYSNYVNLQKSIVGQNGLNIFGGVGIGKLIYPYDDIVDYCVNKALLQSLNNQLLRLDNIFNDEYAKYRRDLEAGRDVKKPDLEEIYINNFESLSKEDVFFKKLKREFTKYDENGNESTNNFEELIERINNDVEKLFNEDNEFALHSEKCNKGKDYSTLAEAQLRKRVSEKENELHDFRIMIESKSEKKAVAKVNALFGVFSDGYKCFIDEYLKQTNEDNITVNSVTIRYILFKLHSYLNVEINNLKEELESLKAKLTKTEEKPFNLKNNTACDALKKLEEAQSSRGLFGSKLKNFRTEYSDKVRRHNKTLSEYGMTKIKYHYFEKLSELTNSLLSEYKTMFSRLSDKKNDINKNLTILYKKHDDSKGTNYLYVLANHKCKDYIWESIPDTVKDSILATNLSAEMHHALFDNFKRKAAMGNGATNSYDRLFEDIIYNNCKKKFIENKNVSELVDINILSALEKECSFKEPNSVHDDYIKERLNDLMDYISPWAPRSETSEKFCVWGISSRCKDWGQSFENKSHLEKLIDEISGIQQHDISISDKLSDKEITYIVAHYGLKVNDFIKFSAGKDNLPDGEYYTSYKKMLEDVSKGRQITPHLDTRWDNLLPDINEGINKQKDIDVAKAFIVGIAKGFFDAKEIDSDTKTVRFVSKFYGNISQINYQGKAVDNKVKNLFDALSFNPELVYNANNEFKKICEEARDKAKKDTDILTIAFVKALSNVKLYEYDDVKNILDIFVKVYQEHGNDRSKLFKERFDSLYPALFEIVKAIVKPYCFGQSEENYKHNYNKVYKHLLETSAYYKSMDINTIEYEEIFEKIKVEIEK